MANEIKMTKLHWDKWEQFRTSNKDTVTKEEQELLCTLHSIYFKHSYYLPCTCSSKTYNTWIDQLNSIHEKGFFED